MPIARVIELWREDLTLDEIGEQAGVSRQRISQRLIEAGFNPAERHARTRARSAATSEGYRNQRAQTIARRAEARSAACRQFEALAAELGVSAYTLGQYAGRQGTYARRITGKGARLGRGKLPQRDSPEGLQIADRAAQAAAPFSSLRIGQLCSRRT